MQKPTSNMFYLLSALSTIFIIVVASSEYLTFSRAENLQQEKNLAATVYNLSRKDLDLANIQYRGKNTLLRHQSEQLQQYYTNDFVSKFLETINQEQTLSKLRKDISRFNLAAGNWYTLEKIEEEQFQANKEQFTNSYNALSKQIDLLISENVAVNEKRYMTFIIIGAPLLLLTFISGVIARRRKQEYNKQEQLANRDLERTSYTVQAGQSEKHVEHTIKTPKGVNPSYIDETTGINNDKGFMHEYNEHKSQTLLNYTAVCLFSIDKLDEIEAKFPADFSDSILKKVGFMLALYHHDRDIIGRIAHNVFAIMLSRDEKSAAVNDCELIRKSIEGNPFTSEGGQKLTITLSGGFVQKDPALNINEIFTKANKVLSMSVQHGGNRIAQLRDKNTALK